MNSEKNYTTGGARNCLVGSFLAYIKVRKYVFSKRKDSGRDENENSGRTACTLDT